MCFLEREVYAFLVSGFAAQCCGPAFFVYGRAAEDDVDGRPRMAAGDTREDLVDRAAQEERRVRDTRGKGGKLFFFFLGKNQEMFSLPSG